jgi:aminoglycoside phosphotransferase (APT) family kinase protein
LGGLANTNLRLRLSNGGPPVLLRFYVRSPGAASIEHAIHQRVAGQVPVPAWFYFAPDNPLTHHPYALLEWVDGMRLELAAPTLEAAQLAVLGRAVGASLAGIHAVTFPLTGFFDADLRVAQPISVGRDGLVGYLHQCLVEGRGGARLGAALTQALLAHTATAGVLLDTWDGPPCLVHGDFGGSNLLVRSGPAGWQVAAVLDWEFAFSGSPFFDLGNLLRPPLGDRPGFAEAVHAGYMAAGGRLPAAWRPMSRLADLLAWADFLNRPVASDRLIRDARANIERTLAGAQALPGPHTKGPGSSLTG